jgi:hypothetical protein
MCWCCHHLIGNAIGFLFERIMTCPDRQLSL